MSKKMVITQIIINGVMFAFFNICLIASIIDRDKICFLFGLLSITTLIFFFIKIKDYKYLTGKLSYREFKMRSEYEYWFYIYGDKAYDMYLEKYK